MWPFKKKKKEGVSLTLGAVMDKLISREWLDAKTADGDIIEYEAGQFIRISSFKGDCRPLNIYEYEANYGICLVPGPRTLELSTPYDGITAIKIMIESPGKKFVCTYIIPKYRYRKGGESYENLLTGGDERSTVLWYDDRYKSFMTINRKGEEDDTMLTAYEILGTWKVMP